MEMFIVTRKKNQHLPLTESILRKTSRKIDGSLSTHRHVATSALHLETSSQLHVPLSVTMATQCSFLAAGQSVTLFCANVGATGAWMVKSEHFSSSHFKIIFIYANLVNIYAHITL